MAVLGGLGTLYAQTPPPEKGDTRREGDTETVPAFRSQVHIDVNETVSVSDSLRVAPSASISLTETVGVVDTPNVDTPDFLPPISITVTEAVGVTGAILGPASAESGQATPVPAAEGAPTTDTEAAPAAAPAHVSMAEGLIAGFCAMAQWRVGQILAVYDVKAKAQKEAQDLANDLRFSLTFDFPDMGAIRQGVQDAADDVCSAADPGAAKAAMTALKDVQDANRVTFQDNKNVIQLAMEAAKAAMKAQIKLEMQPAVDLAKAAMQQDVQNERRAILAAKPKDPDSTAPPSLTSADQQQIDNFIATRKAALQADLQAQASKLGGKDRERMQDIGALFTQQKTDIETLVAANQAASAAMIADFKDGQKQAILDFIDAKITQLRDRLASREGSDGQNMFLAAIDQARVDLETAIDSAFANDDSSGVKTAMDAFWATWAQSTCDTAGPGLETTSSQVQTVLGTLAEIETPTLLTNAAQTAFTSLQTQVGLAQQTCQNLADVNLKALNTALQDVRTAATEARTALEALQAEGGG